MPDVRIGSGSHFELITPSANALPDGLRCLYIASDGTISITNQDDSTEATVPVFGGTTLCIIPQKITAATAIVYGIYN